MKFVIKNEKRENITVLMRKIGYHIWGQGFVRPIGSLPYPRFHIYLKENKKTNEITINLHLDQKKPSYKGVSAHSGEYEGKVVEKEIKRIKNELLR